MKRPWMPFYVADYLQDTAHLSPTEHGAYLLLILHYWIKGNLPEDEESIRRITRLTPRQWAHSCDLLRSLFLPGWRHKRIDFEMAKAIEKSRVNSANAKLSVKDRPAPAKPTPTQSQSQSEDIGPSNEGLPPSKPKAAKPKAPKPDPVDDGWPADHLDQFWNAFPPYRRTAKAKVGEKLARLRAAGLSWTVLWAGLTRYAMSDPGEFAKAPIAWLNAEGWQGHYRINNGGNSHEANRGSDSKLTFAGLAARIRHGRAARSATGEPTAGDEPDDGYRDPQGVGELDSGGRQAQAASRAN